MTHKPFTQMILEMRCRESLLNGAVRVGSSENQTFMLEQLQLATVALTEFNARPGRDDEFWQFEMVADETYFALEVAIKNARDYLRSTIKQVQV